MSPIDALRNNTAVVAWLISAGVDPEIRLHEISGGGNNRVFKVESASTPWLLKEYFTHPVDPRNRMKTEFCFLQYAWDKGVHEVPQPISQFEQKQLALYEYIVGTGFLPGNISAIDMKQVEKFLVHLNEKRENAKGILGAASEACFSVQMHLDCVEGRVRKIAGCSGNSPVDIEAQQFIEKILVPKWTEIKRNVLKKSAAWLQYELTEEEQCLSPSDFGFHNAIRQYDGEIRFVDFEYAGWDDPAKLICDFFCQVRVPVGHEHMEPFVHALSSIIGQPNFFSERVRWLFAVYQIKWCCIVLNEFLPIHLIRRKFADRNETDNFRKQTQLEKAKMILQVIENG